MATRRVRRIQHGGFSWLFLAILTGLCAGSPQASAGPDDPLRGKWVLDPDGDAVGPQGIGRGLQPSGLAFRDGEVWSIGDQRSEFHGHLLRIDPESGRLVGSPLKIEVPAATEGENPHFATYRRTPRVDFEGLDFHPSDSNLLYAVTEDKVPWVAEIRLYPEGPTAEGPTIRPRITHLAEIRFPEGISPWRGDSNSGVEGIALSDDAQTVYLTFERAHDGLPRIFEASLDDVRSNRSILVREVSIAFDKLPPRDDKGRARLNLNDVQFLRRNKRPYLLVVARDQERLAWVDLEAREVVHLLDLRLRDPAGDSIFWVSPEGVTFDVEGDTLWVVNDPDSVWGNYRRRGDKKAKGRYGDYVPLLFEMKLSAALRGIPGRAENEVKDK